MPAPSTGPLPPCTASRHIRTAQREAMQFVNLGSTGLKVSRICLGCMMYVDIEIMKGINRVSIVGWSLLLIGILLILAQSTHGGWPEWLFNLGLTLMIAGTVLRVYGKFGRSKK
jgi:hypothetical protein